MWRTLKITVIVMRRTGLLNNSTNRGWAAAFSLAAFHSSGSGTEWRIQSTSNAGKMPTRKITRSGSFSQVSRIMLATAAARLPRFTPVCSTAAIQGRHCGRPCFRQERRPHGPLAANPQRGQKPKDHQVPPRVGKERQAGEDGVGKNGEHQRPAAAQSIADAPEECRRPAPSQRGTPPESTSAYRPTDGSCSFTLQQVRHERRRHQRVQVHVEPVEQPAEPRRDSRPPLLRREVGQACDFLAGLIFSLRHGRLRGNNEGRMTNV